MADAVFFYLLALLVLAAAVAVVSVRQPVYSVLALLVVMFGIASLFVMLGAFFLAALQILLYAGAVVVLFLFVIMLLNLQPDTLARIRGMTWRTWGTMTALVFLFQLGRILTASGLGGPLTQIPAASGTVESIGRLLFSNYLLPFELTSFLILAAILGAVTLGKQRPSGEPRPTGSQAGLPRGTG